MGYRLQAYSRSELSRVTLPGTAAPSLFWLIPVGVWRPDSIQELEHLFYQVPGPCRNLGLVLVKDDRGRQYTPGGQTDLTALSTSLADILPLQMENELTNMPFSAGTRHALLLSGAYPQPGWGLLLSLSHDPVREIDQLIRHTCEPLWHSEAEQPLKALWRATKAFLEWQSLSDRHVPTQPSASGDLSPLKGKADAYASLIAAVAAADPKLLDAACDQARRMLSGCLPAVCADVALNEFRLLLWLDKLEPDKIQTVFIPLLTDIKDLPSEQWGKRIGQLNDRGLQGAVRAWLALYKKQAAPKPEILFDWKQNQFDPLRKQHIAHLTALKEDVEKAIGHLLTEQERLAEGMERERADHLRTARAALAAFHHSLRDASVAQWDLAPAFLAAVQTSAGSLDLPIQVVAWDPPRMIGWKLYQQGLDIRTGDLSRTARQLLGAAAIAGTAVDQPADTRVDGSYFTDWIHFVVSQDPTQNTRQVTCHCLAELLGRLGLRGTLAAHGDQESHADLSVSQMANRLIDLLGWPSSRVSPAPRPLAACIGSKETGASLADGVTANDLRKAVESLCKDLIDILVAELAGGVEQLIPHLCQGTPPYMFRKADWADEVSNLMIGSANIILRTLLPLVFPEREQTAGELLKALKELILPLDTESHDNATPLAVPFDPDAVGRLCKRMLDAIHRLVGDLPWHLTPSHQSGTTPMVVTGMAWSHGHPHPRLIRVLFWDRPDLTNVVTVRNLSTRNPVMTDVQVLQRSHAAVPFHRNSGRI